MVKFVPDLNLKNDEGNSTIILASIKGYDEIVESLIKMGNYSYIVLKYL